MSTTKVFKNMEDKKNEIVWNNKPFPFNRDSVNYITIPSGKILWDTCVWENFLQEELDMDPNKMWRALQEYPRWDSDKEIPFREKGDDVHWIQGTHEALNYRGHAIKRNKIWCQRKYKKGMYRYGYTGWQHSISYATHSVKKIPVMKEFVKKLNSKLVQNHNHWIITEYKTCQDNIGFHSDKSKDFAENSYFIVIKMGYPRKFEFRTKRTKDNPNPTPFYSKILSAGTAIFVRSNAADGLDANSIVEHGVPEMEYAKVSGSIVSRRIKTRVLWKDVEKNISNAKKAKVKRKENKSTNKRK